MEKEKDEGGLVRVVWGAPEKIHVSKKKEEETNKLKERSYPY